MIVMAKEGMDEAFLRPGRTDVKINYTSCTSQPEAVVLKLFYEADYIKRLWTKIEPNRCLSKQVKHHSTISQSLLIRAAIGT